MKKKKVIFLLDHFEKSNGVVSVLINLCAALDKKKYDITIRPLYRCDMSIKNRLKEGVKIKKVFGFYFRGFSKLLRIIPYKILYKYIVGEKYDIEVAFQCDMSTFIIANSTNKKAVHVAWMHGYEVYPDEYLKMDKVVCVARDNAEKCKTEVDPSVDVTYCHNIQNEKVILDKSKENVRCPEGEGPLLVTVGRLSPEKGFVRLVEILRDLKDEGLKFHLMIIGGGAEEHNIKQAIEVNNMNENVFMMGKQDNPHKYTKNADLYICSSFSESYNTATTEASVLGVPVITTDVSGAREIIEQCECGKVTGIDDESLKNGLREILLNQSLIYEWKHILSTTYKNFNFETGIKNANKLFDELCDISDKKCS